MSKLHTLYLPLAARILLGGIFFVFGLNGFFNFFSMPDMPPPAAEFMGALAATGYMLPLIKVTEIVAGVLLLSGRFVPLALVLLTPGIVNIALFHIVLDPVGLPMAGVLLVLLAYLAWSYRDLYRPMLSALATPTESKSPARRYQREEKLAAAHS